MWPHKKGGINNNQHSYTCAVRCKVLFVQTGGQFKAHSRTCFPMKPSLVFYPFSINITISDHSIYGERHCPSLALPGSLKHASQKHTSPMHHLMWVHQISLANSFICQSQPQLCWSRLLASESTGAGRRLLRHMQNDSSFKFNHMGWRSISELWPLLLNQPTKPAVGQKATCPGGSPALQADVTF